MSKGKLRSRSQIIGEEAVTILRSLFPISWVVREYTPDYGIDLSVELFETYDSVYWTLGEHLYFQVKGTEHLERGTRKVYHRANIENRKLQDQNWLEVPVVKFQLDTALLATVERMGSSVPVILTVIDVIEKKAYFVCLNDYLEKVILPEDPEYYRKETISIQIPEKNVLKSRDDMAPLSWYGKRAKLYALFQKAQYQYHGLLNMKEDDNNETIRHFAGILNRLDAWNLQELYPVLLDLQPKFTEAESGTMELPEALALWQELTEAGYLFESVSKEWFLPTYLGTLTT